MKMSASINVNPREVAERIAAAQRYNEKKGYKRTAYELAEILDVIKNAEAQLAARRGLPPSVSPARLADTRELGRRLAELRAAGANTFEAQLRRAFRGEEIEGSDRIVRFEVFA